MADSESQDFEFDISDLDVEEISSNEPEAIAVPEVSEVTARETEFEEESKAPDEINDDWSIADLEISSDAVAESVGVEADVSDSEVEVPNVVESSTPSPGIQEVEESPKAVASNPVAKKPKRTLKKSGWGDLMDSAEDLLDEVEELDLNEQPLVDEAEFQAVVEHIQEDRAQRARKRSGDTRRPAPPSTQMTEDEESDKLPGQDEVVSELEDSLDVVTSLAEEAMEALDDAGIEELDEEPDVVSDGIEDFSSDDDVDVVSDSVEDSDSEEDVAAEADDISEEPVAEVVGGLEEVGDDDLEDTDESDVVGDLFVGDGDSDEVSLSAKEFGSAEGDFAETDAVSEDPTAEVVGGLEEVSDDEEDEMTAAAASLFIDDDDDDDLDNLLGTPEVDASGGEEFAVPPADLPESDDDLEEEDESMPAIDAILGENDDDDDMGVDALLDSIGIPDDSEGENDGDDSELSDDDILLQAASLMNGGSVPEGVEELVTDASEDAEEESDEDDDDMMVMPSAQDLMPEAEEADEEKEKPKSGNVADRAGDLPATPPAPEVLDDDEEEEGDPFAESAEGGDPFASDSLDGFNIDLDSAEADPMMMEDAEDSFSAEESKDEESNAAEDLSDQEGDAKSEDVKEEPPASDSKEKEEVKAKPSKVRTLIRSLPFAAAIALVAIGWIAMTFKQEIVEHAIGYDEDGSILVNGIRLIASHAIEGFDERDLYHFQWLDSDVRQVADNEIRVNMTLGAKLKEDLFAPVPERRARTRFSFEGDELMHAENFAYTKAPALLDEFPQETWGQLYELSTPKDSVLRMRVGYKLVRPASDVDWVLDGVKVRGYDGDLEWHEGKKVSSFGKHAYNVNSLDFKEAVSSYNRKAVQFIKSTEDFKESELGRVAENKRLQKEMRSDVANSFSQGTFFQGVVINGKDSAEAAEVVLVITESENEGSLLRGVIKLQDGSGASKHFTGSLQFEGSVEHPEGYLKLTTVSFDGVAPSNSKMAFFDPMSTTRMSLRMDGENLEGDSSDVSLRLARNM